LVQFGHFLGVVDVLNEIIDVGMHRIDRLGQIPLVCGDSYLFVAIMRALDHVLYALLDEEALESGPFLRQVFRPVV